MMTKNIHSNIGQLFMAGMPGTDLDESTLSLIRDFNVGGIIFFSRNIEDPMQLSFLCRELQREALRAWGVPLLLAVDQEGGRVARLREPFTCFPGNSAIAESENPLKQAEEFGKVTAREMNMVGLNMNLAPVIDVQRGDLEKHLRGRTFGEDPLEVARLGRIVVRSLQENGVAAVAKHFPGLGQARVDPHFHLPCIEAEEEEIRKVNLVPFKAAIEQGVGGIMSSHAVYPALDRELPATLSHSILTRLLRDTMGFQGLVITDDLEMGAIAGQRSVADAALLAFQAGADVLLVCKGQEHVAEGRRLLSDRLLNGQIPEERVVQSLRRIESTKARFPGRREEVSVAKVREYFRRSA